MSKLPNAPLLEVIFEIKWDITNKNDIVNFQYLHGDLYSGLKDQYKHRESLIAPEIPFEVVKGLPIYRYRKEKSGYPLVQIGLGILTYNTIDNLYYWDSNKAEINEVISVLSGVFPEINSVKLSPSLTYIDFFEIDFEKINVIDFINNNLDLKVQQNIVDDNCTKEVNFTLSYRIDNDNLVLNLGNGTANTDKNGIVLQTKFIGEKKEYTNKELMVWLNKAQSTCSEIFKKITKGELYNSFKL